MTPPPERVPDAQTSVWECELAAIDFETTGLSPDRGDRAIEVAVVRGRFGEPPRRWSALIDPGRAVDATEIHGITDDMVRGEPTFAALVPTLSGLLEGAVLVAHNAAFDLSFLRMEYARAERSPPVVPVLDTLGLARRLLTLPSNSLGAVCTHFGVTRSRAHRALEDASATWEIAWHILGHADPDHRLTLAGAQALCRRRGHDEQREVADALLASLRRSEPILIAYLRADAEATHRSISVQKVAAGRVEAFCHLRGEARIFRLDRIRLLPAE